MASSAEDTYVKFVGRVLHTPMVRFLQAVGAARPDVRAIVVGGRALNVFLKPRYRVESTDWDVRVTSEEGSFNEARDALGRAMASALDAAIRQQRARIAPIDAQFGTKTTGASYEVNPRPFAHASGKFSYLIGHVNIDNTRWRRDTALVDLVGTDASLMPALPAVNLDGVFYLNPVDSIKEMQLVLGLQGYKKKDKVLRRLRLMDEAVRTGGLSCNYYKYLLARAGPAGRKRKSLTSNLRNCTTSTYFGPLDPQLPVPLEVQARSRPAPARFVVSPSDIRAHSEYFASLPPAARRALLAYTGAESARINLTLLSLLSAGGGANATVPAEIATIQRSITSAPALTSEVIVYRVARFIFLRGRSNYALRQGTDEPQLVFTSTTLDNQLNPGPFLDEFAPCCAFVIRIPRGTRGVLILGRNSLNPQESEVLLPFGSFLHIDRANTYGNVTYMGLSRGASDDVFYNEMRVYATTYVPPQSDDEVQTSNTVKQSLLAGGGPNYYDVSSVDSPEAAGAVMAVPALAKQFGPLLAAA